MAALQTVAFGAASDGSQGDSVRTGFTKDNSNVAVLQKQATLTTFASTVTTAQALTVAHIGQRVNINLATAGIVNLPSASTCAADNVLLLRNLGTTVVTLAITTGSGDTVALSKLNPGESALMDTDGVHAWTCLFRGRAITDNEAVVGALSVGGAYSGPSAAYTGNVTVGGTLGVTGAAAFTVRPTFAGNTPWDSGNLVIANYMPKAGGTFTGGIAVSGALSCTANLTVTGAAYASQYNVGTGGVLLIYDGGSGNITLRTGGAARYFSFDNVGNGNALNGTWINGSDERLKQNIVTIDSPLARVLAMRGVYYEMKDTPGERKVGVIAQEVQAQFPEAVSSMGGEDNYLGVAYGNLVGPLIEAIRELSINHEAALERIAALEAKLA
jgi:hypothetical protein